MGVWKDYYWSRFRLRVKIYLPHDEKMGQVLFPDGFISPNMPKLQYALLFSTKGRKIELGDTLVSHTEADIFEKHDGFNLIAYRPPQVGEVVFKTRMLPEASETIRTKILTHKLFPREQIIQMVNDGYIPVMEVYGPMLREHRVGHGPVNMKKLYSLGRIQYLNVALLAVRLNKPGYPYLSPEKMMKIADEYGLPHATYFGTIKVTRENVINLMNEVAEYNERQGFIAREGYVLHTVINGKYLMLKVKPLNIMTNDVIGVSTDAIKKEIAKVLQDYDVEIVVNREKYSEFLEQIITYLSEEHKITRKQRRTINMIVSQIFADILKQKYTGITKEQAGRMGVHGMVIRYL